MINIRVTLLIVFFYCLSGSGQTYSIPFGSEMLDEGGSTIMMGPSGDYFIGGFAENEGLLCRISSTGELVWSKSIDFGVDPDYIMELTLTSDNYIIGCGNARTAGSSNLYGFVFKANLDGDLIWSRQISGDDNYIWTRGLIEAENGNYRVFGGCREISLNNYVVEFDEADGVHVWDTLYVKNNIYNGWDEDFYDGLTHANNDASYFGGRFETSSGAGSFRPSLTKINADGELEWSKTYLYNSATSGGRFYCTSIIQDADSLVLSLLCKDGGVSAPFETGLIKTDLEGNIGWAKLYYSPGIDLRSYGLVKASDGYIISGWEQTGEKSLFMIKTDDVGNVIWSKSYGGEEDEDIKNGNSNSLVLMDGEYVITVARTSSFTGSNDILLVKADAATGELDDGACYNDLTIVAEDLPNVQYDYSLESFSLPMTSPDPDMAVDDLIFDINGEILDFIADTIVSGDSIFLCSNEPFELFADWVPTLDFLWSTGGVDQLEAVTETGVYWVDVSSDGCLIWSDTVTIIFGGFDIELGEDTLICDDSEYMIDAGFIDDATYLWNDGSTDQTLMVYDGGEYWVTVEKGDCIVSDSISINFVSLNIDLGTDTLICFEESLLLDAANPGATYLWNDGTTDQTLLADESGWYWVEVSDGGCSKTDSILLTISDLNIMLPEDVLICDDSEYVIDAGFFEDATYSWSDGGTDQVLTVSDGGHYWVTVEDGECIDSDTIIITYDSLNIHLGSDTLICFGESLLLDGANPGATYLWNDGTTDQTLLADESGWYWVEVSVEGCSKTDSVLITVSDIHVELYNDTIICEGETLLLDAGDFSETYMWGDGSIEQTFLVDTEGTYSVIISDGICSSTDEIIVTFLKPFASFEADPLSGCVPFNVKFSDLSTTALGTINSWNWSFGDGFYSIEENPEHVYTVPGEFDVSLTINTDLGCADDSLVVNYILANEGVTADFSYSPSYVSTDDIVTFTSFSANAISWHWDFGDGTFSNNENPTHQFEGVGEFVVTLTVMNEFGCNETITKKLKVIEANFIYVPNVFTPDGNNFNEVWKPSIYGIDIYDFHLILYNRWGEVIWESYNPNAGWNGYYGDELVQDGVYVWVITYGVTFDDDKRKIEGHVTVLR